MSVPRMKRHAGAASDWDKARSRNFFTVASARPLARKDGMTMARLEAFLAR